MHNSVPLDSKNTDDRLELIDLIITFPDGRGNWKNAIDGVSLELHRCERVGLVGESGCGKSLTALATVGLAPEHGRIENGSVVIDGVDILGLDDAVLNHIRGGTVGIVFQEAKSAFNPVFSIGSHICETHRHHLKSTRSQARRFALEILTELGFDDPEAVFASYPHQLSGGEAQRAMIALALAAEPSYLIADEPTTALDVTVQAQVLQHLNHMVKQRSLGLLLVSHDLTIVRGLVDRVIVMYAGEVVEQGSTAQVFDTPHHPYSRLLVEVARNRSGPGLQHLPPPNVADAQGCRFAPRCIMAQEECSANHPALKPGDDGRLSRCPIVAGEGFKR
ncbi:MAG: ABC transporter ATP-binding protein [bacterium]|nr:ABC transporter ATP-binding protein [bacterium]